MWRQIETVWSMNYLLCTNRWVVNNFSLYWREISATFTNTAVNNYLVYTKEKLANVSRWTEQWWEIKLLTWIFSSSVAWKWILERGYGAEQSRNPVWPQSLFASKRLRKTEPIRAEENRDGIVNEPSHADQIFTVRKQIATLEFRDLMLLINTTRLAPQNECTFNLFSR